MKPFLFAILFSVVSQVAGAQTMIRVGSQGLLNRAIPQSAENGFISGGRSMVGVVGFLQVSVLPNLFFGPFLQFSAIDLYEPAYQNMMRGIYDSDDYFVDYRFDGSGTEISMSILGAQLSYVYKLKNIEIVPFIRAAAGHLDMRPLGIHRKRKNANYTESITFERYTGVAFYPVAGIQLGHRLLKDEGTYVTLGFNCSYFSHLFTATDTRRDIYDVTTTNRLFKRRHQFTTLQAEVGITHTFPLKRPKKD